MKVEQDVLEVFRVYREFESILYILLIAVVVVGCKRNSDRSPIATISDPSANWESKQLFERWLEPHLVDYWEAQSLLGTTESGETVTSWTSARGRRATVRDGEGAVFELATTPLDGPSLRFDGSTNMMIENSPVGGLEEFGAAVVIRLNGNGWKGDAWWQNAGILNADWGVGLDNFGRLGFGLGQPNSTVRTPEDVSFVDSRFHVVVATAGVKQISLAVDDSVPVTSQRHDRMARIDMGLIVGGVMPANLAPNISSNLVGFYFFDRELEDGEIAVIQAYLREKFIRPFDDTDQDDDGTLARVLDTDKDGLSDQTEFETGTNPLNSDSDDDGLTDRVETNSGRFANLGDVGTDPLNPDSNENGFSDYDEIVIGEDPNANPVASSSSTSTFARWLSLERWHEKLPRTRHGRYTFVEEHLTRFPDLESPTQVESEVDIAPSHTSSELTQENLELPPTHCPFADIDRYLVDRWGTDSIAPTLQSGDEITSWVSDRGATLTTEGESAPHLATEGTPSGAPVVRFRGNSRLRGKESPLAGLVEFTVVALLKIDQPGRGRPTQWWSNSVIVGADWGLAVDKRGTLGFGMAVPDRTLYSEAERSFVDGKFHVISMTASKQMRSLIIDSISPKIDRNGYSDPRRSMEFTVGGEMNSELGTPFFQGDLVEIRFYKKALKRADIAKLKTYLTAHYLLQFPKDTDGDKLPDYWERMWGYSTTNSNADEDTDEDGMTNYQEFLAGTNPRALDTDGDGLSDLEEIQAKTNPRAVDSDGDGLTDKMELEFGSDPWKPDTDDDGFPDRYEQLIGSDPLVPDHSSADFATLLRTNASGGDWESPAIWSNQRGVSYNCTYHVVEEGAQLQLPTRNRVMFHGKSLNLWPGTSLVFPGIRHFTVYFENLALSGAELRINPEIERCRISGAVNIAGESKLLAQNRQSRVQLNGTVSGNGTWRIGQLVEEGDRGRYYYHPFSQAEYQLMKANPDFEGTYLVEDGVSVWAKHPNALGKGTINILDGVFYADPPVVNGDATLEMSGDRGLFVLKGAQVFRDVVVDGESWKSVFSANGKITTEAISELRPEGLRHFVDLGGSIQFRKSEFQSDDSVTKPRILAAPFLSHNKSPESQPIAPRPTRTLNESMAYANENREELATAWNAVPGKDTEHLIRSAWQYDLVNITADHLVQTVRLARQTYRLPYIDHSMDHQLWGEYVLPFRVLDEDLDNWRPGFYKRLMPLVRETYDIKDAVHQVFEWYMTQNIAFQYNEFRHQSPRELLKTKAGSCPESNLLFVALLRSIGIPARHCIALRWRNENSYHYFTQFWDPVDQRWLAIDVSGGQNWNVVERLALGGYAYPGNPSEADIYTQRRWQLCENISADFRQTGEISVALANSNQFTATAYAWGAPGQWEMVATSDGGGTENAVFRFAAFPGQDAQPLLMYASDGAKRGWAFASVTPGEEVSVTLEPGLHPLLRPNKPHTRP